MLRLHIQPLPGTSFEHLVQGSCVVLGRSTDCDVTLRGKFISRRHARLRQDEDLFTLEDLGSHNGTKLNGQDVVTATTVEAGDVIHIANYVITVDDVPVPASFVASSLSRASSSVSGLF